MFDIGFPELVVVSIIALLVLGPERLPEALRTMGLWLGRLRRSFSAVKSEIEKEIGMDDIRRQLHNEAIMEEMERIEAEVKSSMDTDDIDHADTDTSANLGTEENTILPRTTPQEPNEATSNHDPANTESAEKPEPNGPPGTGSRTIQTPAQTPTDAADFANEPLTDIELDASTEPQAESKTNRVDH